MKLKAVSFAINLSAYTVSVIQFSASVNLTAIRSYPP